MLEFGNTLATDIGVCSVIEDQREKIVKANPTLLYTLAVTMGESQLQRIIKDLQDAISELSKEFKEMGEPITDDSTNLQKFFYKLEYLLQFDLKEKSTLLGNKKDYWDYFCDCVAKVKGANDGIRFVKSTSELKTSLGKGRAFLRYSLVHQRLADTLQQCFMNNRVTGDWYFARSPFLNTKTSLEIVGYLYELTDVQFDLASRGYDLDAAWPTFARRTLGSSGSAYNLWRPPSRSSSMSSLLSTNLQNQDLTANHESHNTLNVDALDSLDEMQIELDENEIRIKELEMLVTELKNENQGLHKTLYLQLEKSNEEIQANNTIVQETGHLIQLIEELQKQEFSKLSQNMLQELQCCLYSLKSKSVQNTETVRTLQANDERQIKTQSTSLKHSANEKLKKSEGEHESNKHEIIGKISVEVLDSAGKSDGGEKMSDPLEINKEQDVLLKRITSLENALAEALADNKKWKDECTVKEETQNEKDKTISAQIHILEERLSKMSQNICDNEKENSQLIQDKDYLTRYIKTLEEQTSKEAQQITDLTEKNDMLIIQNKENEEAKSRIGQYNTKLQETICAMEAQIQSFSELEKHLQNQLNDALQSVDEKHTNLSDLNKNLDESLQVSRKQCSDMNEKYEILENRFREIQNRAQEANSNLLLLQTEHNNAIAVIAELEKSIACLKENERLLNAELHDNRYEIKGSLVKLFDLANEMETNVQQSQKVDLDHYQNRQNKICIPSITENSDHEQKSTPENTPDLSFRIFVAEKQLMCVLKEIKKLQIEIVAVNDMLSVANENTVKAAEKLTVTETLLNEKQNLVQQLEEQIELLKDKEEQLREENEQYFKQKDVEEDLDQIKTWDDKFQIEHSETQERLSRANIDIDTLRTQVLTLEKGNEKLTKDLAILEHSKEALEENLKNNVACAATITSLQERLSDNERKLKSVQESSKEEMSTMKFHNSTEILNYQKEIKAVNDKCEKLKQQLEKETQTHLTLQQEIIQMQHLQFEQSQKLNDEMKQSELESSLTKYEDESKTLKEYLERTRSELEIANRRIKEQFEELKNFKMEKEINDQKLTANIDDLNRTKQYLEERLIELIRDKDALWQKSDALEYEQKIRASERWMVDVEVNQCLDCKKTFNWMVRRHHCRFCGRIFCYYCCNNYVMTKHSGKKERCCKMCFNRDQIDNSCDSEVLERTELRTSTTTGVRGVTVTEDSGSPKDAGYDIITDEDLNHVLHSTLLSDDQDPLEQSTVDLNSSSNSLTADDSEELQIAQDNEIHLLTTGELMVKLPMTVEEIMLFGENDRELFIKSGTYSIIPITVTQPGLTITWIFSLDTKSISFSVVYQETESAPLDQCKVLIPMIRCNSQKQPIQGELKVRNPGIYSLIFDNTFSRFLSKRVFYRLAVEQPVVYDGSDSL
uniref:FYVE and coiled-coil domain-containing protein 1 n=1 Tax=Leptobrachium leishanense TaxID=445787 RepID=A0A8C5PZB7_9ANUR